MQFVYCIHMCSTYANQQMRRYRKTIIVSIVCIIVALALISIRLLEDFQGAHIRNQWIQEKTALAFEAKLTHDVASNRNIEQHRSAHLIPQQPVLNQSFHLPVRQIKSQDITASTQEIEETIQKQRDYIKNELTGVVVRPDLYGMLTRNDYLSKFTLEKGGTPIRVLLITNWRSGSSFTLHMLDSIPGMVTYYEPMLCLQERFRYDFIARDDSPLLEESLTLLKNIYNCNFPSMPKLVQLFQKVTGYLRSDKTAMNLGEVCGVNGVKPSCNTEEFMMARCKMSPFQTIKETRLTLKQAEELLRDYSLSLKVIYLVRDPRSIMLSRHPIPNFRFPDASLQALCSKLKEDLSTAKKFSVMYPDKFRVLRYEDIILNAHEIFRRLLHFLGFEMHPLFVKLLGAELRKTDPFYWRNQQSRKRVDPFEVQKSCMNVMVGWGYNTVSNLSMLTDFNPMMEESPFKL